MDMDFCKMHGIGNDFIVIDDRKGVVSAAINYPELAEKICHRHFGIGGDGILLISDSEDHDFKFRIFNSDGSQAEMCGNGIRCVAKYVYENKIVDKAKMQVDTLAGTVVPEVIVDDKGVVTSVEVDMGQPILTCRDIPFECDREQALEEPLVAGGKTYNVTAVSMGNPHAVIFVDDTDDIDVTAEGRLIEVHERFSEKTNVEFIQVVSRNELIMKVWERGAGITLACGTGACAAFVAANITGRADDKAVVHLDGGDLEISWDRETNHIFMQGPAEFVFSGNVTI